MSPLVHGVFPAEPDGFGASLPVLRTAIPGPRSCAAIDRLAPAERSLLVLRGIEQCSYAEIAAVLGGAPKSLAVAYGRLLGRLRRMMPGSVFDEFDAGTADAVSELENRRP